MMDIRSDLPNAQRLLAQAWAAAFRPKPRLSLSQWAGQTRILSSKAASEPGPWRNARTPYLVEIMDRLSLRDPCSKVVFCKSTQVGGSEVGLNWGGYVVDHAPGPMLIVQPTLEIAELFSKQRFAPMIRDSKRLRKILPEGRGRNNENNVMLKSFPGGIIRFAGANSASSLASMPVCYLMLDEVDRYEHDIDDEGDPVQLAERRTSSFARRKIFYCSTPGIKGASRITSEYLLTDQRRYFVPCPHCGHRQVLVFDRLKFDEDSGYCAYACEECDALIDEHHKTAMLAAGEWRPTATGQPGAVGYHINGLYTPMGLGNTWAEHARTWRTVQADPAKKKSFVNTVLGEAWEDTSAAINVGDLLARRGEHECRTIPEGCLMLTCGVDVQHNRLAVQVLGWGRSEKCWVIDWLELYGDPARDEVWQQLDTYLATPIVNRHGVPMRIEATAIDTGGHHTHDVYNYCRGRRHAAVFAVKGSSQTGRAVVSRPNKVDINWRGKQIKAGVELWSVGTDTAKSAIFARLRGDAEQPPERQMIVFPSGLDPDYFEQLTAEYYDPERRRWKKKKAGGRNEALDTFVYAMFAAQKDPLRVHRKRESDWLRREQVLQPAIRDLFGAAPEAVPDTEQEDSPPVRVAGLPAPPPPKRPKAKKINARRPSTWRGL